MGVKLMVEVLDRYHGPNKLWLVGFAEQANDETRVGWPRRDLLARRADVMPWRSSHIAAELVAEGTIKRPDWEPDEGRDRRRAAYILLPLAGSDARKRTRKGAADSTEIGAADSTDPGEMGAADSTEIRAADSTDPGEIGAIHNTHIGAVDSTEPEKIGAVFGEVGAVFGEVGAIEPPVSADQTANLPSPQSPQSPHIKPSRRTTRNRSRGRAAATDDDDFDSLLDKLGADAEPEREFIRSLARTGGNAGYLRQQIESDGGEAFMRYVRRMVAEPGPEPGGQDDEAGEYPF